MKKYELTGETKEFCGTTLHRIRAVRTFRSVNAEEIGGWIEKEENLSHDGDADVYGNAWASGDADVRKQSHWLCIGPIGSRNDITTFYRTRNGAIKVVCGCFRGTIDKFEDKVAERHGDSKYAKQYTAAIDVAKACIDLVEEWQ